MDHSSIIYNALKVAGTLETFHFIPGDSSLQPFKKDRGSMNFPNEAITTFPGLDQSTALACALALQANQRNVHSGANDPFIASTPLPKSPGPAKKLKTALACIPKPKTKRRRRAASGLLLPTERDLKRMRKMVDSDQQDDSLYALALQRQRMRKINSRATTPTGVSLVLWHGSESCEYDDFDKSKTKDGVFWFCEKREYCTYRGDADCENPRAAHLTIQFPATADHIREYAEEIDLVIDIGLEIQSVIDNKFLLRKLIDHGHDGIMAHELTPEGEVIVTWGVFQNTQIVELKGTEIDEAIEEVNNSLDPVSRVRNK